jgi:AraC-like DNA-binding protein
MRNSSEKRFNAVPSAEGGITRLAFACAQEKGADVDTLLRKAGLSRAQIEDSYVRISVRSQVEFLDLIAQALGDDLLGFHLAQNFDLRRIGLMYYVLASSETLGDALGRAARYSSVVNEGFRATIREGREIYVVLESVGIPRRLNRHQIEFWFATFIRACREITQRRLTADYVSFVHRRSLTAELSSFFGGDVKFGADVDQVTFSRSILDIAVANADPYLNKLLVKQYDDALAHRKLNRNAFVGYQDVSSFTHAFRRWTGKTPRTARQDYNEGILWGMRLCRKVGSRAAPSIQRNGYQAQGWVICRLKRLRQLGNGGRYPSRFVTAK